jgi:hypothetical protein
LVREVVVDGSGRYSLEGLAPGEYFLYAGDSARFVDWSLDGESPIDVGVAGSVEFPVIELVEAAWFSGTVVDGRGRPVSDIAVTVSEYPDGVDEPGIEVGGAVSGPDGTFQTDGLVPGSYLVSFTGNDDVLGGYYPGVRDVSDASSVDAEPGRVANLGRIQLGTASKIGGLVLDESSAPVEGIEVSAMLLGGLDDDGYEVWDAVDSATSGSNGVFTVGGLPPGKYVLWFNGADRFVSEYAGSEYVEDATRVSVSSGRSASIGTVRLRRGAVIAGGTVTAGGLPAAGVEVRVLLYREFADEELWDTVGWAVTDEGGGYVVAGLTGGDYVVEFSDPNVVLENALEDGEESQEEDPGSSVGGEPLGDETAGTAPPEPAGPGDLDDPGGTETPSQDPTPTEGPQTVPDLGEPSPDGPVSSGEDSDVGLGPDSGSAALEDSGGGSESGGEEVVGGGYVAVRVDTGDRVVVPQVVLYPELASGLPDGQGPDDVFAVPFNADGIGDPLGIAPGAGVSEVTGGAGPGVTVVPVKDALTAKKGKSVVLKVAVKNLPAGSKGKVVVYKSGKKVASAKVSAKGTVKVRVKAKYLSQARNKLVLRFEGASQSTSKSRTVVVRVK